MAAGLALAAGAVPASAASGYTVTATIPVGSFPAGVAVDPAAGTVFVANEGDDTVSMIDAATGTVTATIPVGQDPNSAPIGVAADPAAGTIYVTLGGDSEVSAIDVATDEVTASFRRRLLPGLKPGRSDGGPRRRDRLRDRHFLTRCR